MPTWSEILKELSQNRVPNKAPSYDAVRRRYLYGLHEYGRRNVILYASAWIQKEIPPALVAISDEDIHALMEVSSGLQGPDLDLILHSPGGSSEAAEAVVSYLRSRFSNIRVFVPHLARSAATMVACAADEIVLGPHSFLGPTDPQLLLATPLGVRLVPAQEVLDQFDKAQRECADAERLSAWLPMLNQYGPDLLVRCETALELSKELLSKWLKNYMFKDKAGAVKKAQAIADWLSDHKHFKSHNRNISRQELEEHGLRIKHLEDDKTLQDLTLSVFHATCHTFTGTSAVKIVENHQGRAFVKQQIVQQAQVAKK